MTAPPLPDDWRERVTAMIARQAPLDGALFAGGPALDPLQQIGVYRNQYDIRLFDALADEVLGLRHLLGDRARPVLNAFLDAHPSRSWTLNRVAHGLVDWLIDQGAPVEQIEMARLDAAVQRGFLAADGRAITPDDLGALPDLCLQPAVSLLRLTTNAHLVRAAAVAGGSPPPIEHGLDVPLVLFRNGLRMRHWELDPAAWSVLDRIAQGATTLDALTAVVEAGHVAPDALASAVSGWFRDFVAHQLVQIR